MLEGLLDDPEACWVIAHICTHLPVYPTILADREAGSPMGSSGTYSHDCTNGKGSGNGRSLNRTIALSDDSLILFVMMIETRQSVVVVPMTCVVRTLFLKSAVK